MGDRDSVPTFAIGFTLGAVIGLAIGFLFAPRPGKEIRELVKEKAADIPETARGLTANREKVYTQTWSKRSKKPKVSDTYFE